MFNTDTFLQSTVNDASSTVLTPIPEGIYAGAISKVDLRQTPGKKDPTQNYLWCDVTWTLQVPQPVLDEIGRKQATVRQSFGLDLTDSNTLDMGKGKNVTLGRLREAVKQNQAGKPWSFNMLKGAAAKVQVKHRPDGDKLYEDVASITAL